MLAFVLALVPFGTNDAALSPTPATLHLLDLTGDGALDKLTRAGDGSLRVEVNIGGRSFVEIRQELPPSPAGGLLAGDLDGDGLTDLYLVGAGPNVALLGDGLGHFREATASLGLEEHGNALAVERIDVDGDGLDDLVLHNASGDVLFWAESGGWYSRSDDEPEALTQADGVNSVETGSSLGSAPFPSLVGIETMGTQAIDGVGTLDVLANVKFGDFVKYFHVNYVNDNQGEVDSLDINDGSLTGEDISTLTGNVGIGTLTPANKLDVHGGIAIHGTKVINASGEWIGPSSGLVGPTGPAGADGAAGPAGPTGAPGTDGADGATGPAGSTGAAGTNGVDGATGPAGPTGAAGANGADGAAGPAGPTGAAGTNGVDGATGPAGSTGAAGTNGVDGATGPAGPTGAAGTNGVDGATGPAGPTGTPGINGVDGATGPAGPTGTPGANGTDGATGPAGPTGPQGPTGPAGMGGGGPHTGGINNSYTPPTFIGGGENNTISVDAAHSIIGGGYANTINESPGGTGLFYPYAMYGPGGGHTVGGGRNNVAGGGYNYNGLGYSTVSGGKDNSALGALSTVGGGEGNSAGGIGGTIGGGESNTASQDSSTVSGGKSNTASGRSSTVTGGDTNTASGRYSTVLGGDFNVASGRNAIVGGSNSTSSGLSSTVPGGRGNTASGDYSFAAGRLAKADDQGSFVWGDSRIQIGTSKLATGTDTFNVYASGGATFFTNSIASTGVNLPAGGGAWASLSDRNAKENVEPVDTARILELLSQLDISTWNYKAQDDEFRHMGPMAQDFHAAFGLGESDKHIATIDPDGVALAAIQELNRLLVQLGVEKDAQIAELRERMEAMAREIELLGRD